MIVAKTKIDACFPTTQFSAEGYYKPYRLDLSEKSGGILVYINSSIPSIQLYCGNLNLPIQTVPFEINLRNYKWLVISVYRPPSQIREYFLNELNKMIDYFSVSYDNHVIKGDFNLESSTGLLKHFMTSNALYNLIKVIRVLKAKELALIWFWQIDNVPLKTLILLKQGWVTITTWYTRCLSLHLKKLNLSNYHTEITKTSRLIDSRQIWKMH